MLTLYLALPMLLVVAGLVLLGAIAYLAHLVKRHRTLLGSLLSQNNLDPLKLPASAWPVLAAGGFTRLEYTGNWFGQKVQGDFGQVTGTRPFTFDIVANSDVELKFTLYAGTNHGENRLFAENLSGVFRLLLETAVHRKMEALSAALTEQAKLTLYLQHDLRNLAQWVEWLAADFAGANDDTALLGIAQRLKNSAPHAATRAEHILAVTRKTKSPAAPQILSLADLIRNAAEHAGINIEITQDALVFMQKDQLNRTLDNLFTNVAPMFRSHTNLSIRVAISSEGNMATASIKMPRLEEVAQLPPEKLFEPFSSGRPGGLGLGLYQAHKSLQEAGGDLTAELHEYDIRFLLTLPCSR
jgi:signal transduction histidine kinase